MRFRGLGLYSNVEREKIGGEREKSLAKTWGRPFVEEKDIEEEEITRRQDPLSMAHKKIQQMPTGVNSVVDSYSLLVNGTQGAHLWSLNLSSYPADQRRLLSISGATTYLVNYPQNGFPSTINILLNQVGGYKSASGQDTHGIATLAPSCAAVPQANAGQIVGYNVHYSMVGPSSPIDITGIPVLTFDVTVDASTTALTYPLASTLAILIQITHVTL